MNSVVKFLIKLHSDSGNVLSVARQVTSQLDTVRAKAQGVGASLKRAFSNSAFSPSAFSSALMSIPGMEFLTNPYALMGAGIGAITQIGMEAEMTANSFTTLVGSEQKAMSVLAEIKAFAERTPFSRLELTQNAQKMMNFGVATDKAMTFLRQLGDISGGNAERLGSLSLVMGQVTAAGKLMGQDLIQFVNAGFNPLQELSIMTGKSYGELRKMMEDGAISADHVASAIAHATGEGGKFHNLLENMKGTVGVQLQQALGNLQTMAIELFEQIRPYVSRAIALFTKSIPYISLLFKGLLTLIIGGIKFIKDWWMELALVASIIGIVATAIYAKTIALTVYGGWLSIVAVATKVWTSVQWLLNAALSANPIGIVIVAIAALVAVIIYCWNRFAGFRAFIITAWDTFKKLGTVIKDYVVNRINEMLEGLGKVGKALQLLLSGNFSEAWDTFKEGVKGIQGRESNAKAWTATKDIVQGVQGTWQKNLQNEEKKQTNKSKEKGASSNPLGIPSLKGSQPMDALDFSEGGKGKRGKKSKTADAIATGGSRPTTINIHISKLIETLAVTMMDKSDTHEIERVVLEALNRSLAIATSTE